jgi:hypothetical protein
VYRLVNPYVQPELYVRKPGDDYEQTYRFHDDDPFFSEVSNLIDVIEDIEEDPEAAQILSTYDGLSFFPFCRSALIPSEQTRSERMNLRGPSVKPASALVQPSSRPAPRPPRLRKLPPREDKSMNASERSMYYM